MADPNQKSAFLGYTVEQVCEALDWDPKTLRRHTKAGRMPRPQWAYEGRVRRLLYPPETIEQGRRVQDTLAGRFVGAAGAMWDNPLDGYLVSQANQIFVDWIRPNPSLVRDAGPREPVIVRYEHDLREALRTLPVTAEYIDIVVGTATSAHCTVPAILYLLRGYASDLAIDSHNTRVIPEVAASACIARGQVHLVGDPPESPKPLIFLPLTPLIQRVWDPSLPGHGNCPQVRYRQPPVVVEILNDDTVIHYDTDLQPDTSGTYGFGAPVLVRAVASARTLPMYAPHYAEEPLRPRGRPLGRKDSTTRKTRASKGSTDAR